MTAAFSANGFAPKQRIPHTITIQNVSAEAIHLIRPEMGVNYDFIVVDRSSGRRLPKLVPPRGGVDFYPVGIDGMNIAAGDSFVWTFYLDDYVDMSRPGTYDVSVNSGFVRWGDTRAPLGATSNVTTIRVRNSGMPSFPPSITGGERDISAGPAGTPVFGIALALRASSREQSLSHPIKVQLLVRNLGTATAVIDGLGNPAMYRFAGADIFHGRDLETESPSTVSSFAIGPDYLYAGKEFDTHLTVNAYLRFERPGTYRISASLIRVSDARGHMLTLVSNPVTINVTP